MDKILVLTDVHVVPEGETIIGLDPGARLTAALEHALARHADAAALVIMGDLTHHGTGAEYHRLKGLLADLPLPVIPMIGNHDRRAPFQAAFPQAPRTAEGHVQGILDLAHHRIITLDTLDGPPYPRGHHAGRLCAHRMAWLEAALAGAGGRTCLVFAHHPPFPVGIPGMDAIPLAEGDKLLALLAAHRPVHLFCGHVHRTISGTTGGVGWTMFKSTCHQGPLDLATPDSSLSIDEPGAYGVLLLPPGGVIAHSEDVLATPAAISERASRQG
ncbi:MAG: phosphodiesterase [Limimaricola sp.]|uniref:phosphodiesterase n=1 Tax=Limimaricola sp. TaxID=2211665 RepID=UPI001DA73AEA|nr:phosphodiesterase [Limimaricola sp.]MBI1418599.1 phosphodiesterase [Limimaricola sp.]